MLYQNINECRSCGSGNLKEIVSFGKTPVSDRLLVKEDLHKPTLEFPLDLMLCTNCSLAQISCTVSPKILFCQDYPYFSSVSTQLMNHFKDSAYDLMEQKKLDSSHYVVEAASNDGYMLRHFVDQGIPVQGVDPAIDQVRVARKKGVNTAHDFFGTGYAKKLVREGKKADLFLANNVLAHVADLRGFVEGIRILLKDDGLAVIEAPYLLDLVEHGEFDTIYHQHLCYFSVTALDVLFRQHGLYLNDIKPLAIHGGSLRLFVEKNDHPSEIVRKYLFDEGQLGINCVDYYVSFVEKVTSLKSNLLSCLQELKQKNKRIVGYGAAAKANTFLSYTGVGKNFLDYVIDMNEYKHGRYFDGCHLPIYSPSKLLEDQPDYMLILAWNFADEIRRQQSEFAKRGGKFIIPIPKFEVV